MGEVTCNCHLKVEGGPAYYHSRTCPVFATYWERSTKRLDEEAAEKAQLSDGCGDTDPEHGGVRQLVVHPAAWNALERWFASRGLSLARISKATEDELETWIISVPKHMLEDHNASSSSGTTGLGTGRLSDL